MGLRTSHLYISLVPAVLMALLGLAAVLAVVMVGTTSPMGRLALVLIAVGAVIVVGAAIFGADAAVRRERYAFGNRTVQPPSPVSGAGDAQRRLGELGFLIARGRQELQGLKELMAAGEVPAPRSNDVRAAPADDPFAQLTYELRVAQNEAWNCAVGAASLNSGGGDSAQRVEVFVNLARRMQTLSHRAIQGLDELENQVEDPDLLKGLFRVDHLSTRMRRQAESLAVIGGAAPRRQWSRPVTVYEVLRSAIAEVEHYNRVKVVPPVEGTLDGGAVADVIHLLAELIENATKFAPPHTQVLIRAEPVTAGLAIEVEDRGLGIPRESQRRLNSLLADLDHIDVEGLLKDGRIGLVVVSALSRRHSIAVRLDTNLYGGTQAVVVVPNELIGSEQQEMSAPATAAPEPTEPVAALSAGVPGSFSSATPRHSPVTGSSPSPVPGGHEAPTAHLGDTPAGTSWQEQSATAPSEQGKGRSGVSSPGAGGQRPELPRRRAQANLAPELVNAPAPRDDDDTDAELNPGLMAAFQKGMRSGQDDEDPQHRIGGTG